MTKDVTVWVHPEGMTAYFHTDCSRVLGYFGYDAEMPLANLANPHRRCSRVGCGLALERDPLLDRAPLTWLTKKVDAAIELLAGVAARRKPGQ